MIFTNSSLISACSLPTESVHGWREIMVAFEDEEAGVTSTPKCLRISFIALHFPIKIKF